MVPPDAACRLNAFIFHVRGLSPVPAWTVTALVRWGVILLSND